MGIQSAQATISRELRDFGFWPTLYDLSFRAVNRIVPFTIWKAIVIDQPHPDFMKLPAGFQARLLEAREMRPYIGEETDIEKVFVDQAAENGDRCMAVFDGDRLANYGWYSNQVTDINEELQLRFDPSYVYMYKGFTPNDYRGKRLHAVAMTLALQEHLGRGFKGLLSMVASNNFSSLKSCYRMGYRDFGEITGVKLGGRFRLRHSKGCEKYDMVMEPKPVGQERTSVVRVA